MEGLLTVLLEGNFSTREIGHWRSYQLTKRQVMLSEENTINAKATIA